MKTIVGNKTTLTIFNKKPLDIGFCLESNKTGNQYKNIWAGLHGYKAFTFKRLPHFLYIDFIWLYVSITI